MLRLIKIMYIITKILLLILKTKNIKTQNATKNIRLYLEKLGPIFIKLGQILSTRIDVLPHEIANELKKLQTNTNYYNFKEIKKIIENDFKKQTVELFEKINENPIASASIAQLHTAVSIEKKKIIIKIIKPNIITTIKKDLLILKYLAKIIHIIFKKIRRLKPMDIVKEIELTMMKEINLKNEAINMVKIKTNFNKSEKIYIPQINLNTLTKNVLILEYIDGINILNKKKLKKMLIDTKLIVINLLDMFYTQTFKYNLFHADLHPGNILISKNNINNPIIILIDLGITGALTKNEKTYLSNNLLAFSQKKYKRIINLHIKANTISKKNNLQELENELYVIFDPILNKKIENIPFKHIMLALIDLSKKANMQLQPNLILFQKTLLAIESISREINPSSNLWEITRHSIEKIIIEHAIKKLINKKKSKITVKSQTKNLTLNSTFKLTMFYITIMLIIITLAKYKIQLF